MSPTLNVNLTSFVSPCKILLKFQLPMTMFHHKLLTREGKGFGQWMKLIHHP